MLKPMTNVLFLLFTKMTSRAFSWWTVIITVQYVIWNEHSMKNLKRKNRNNWETTLRALGMTAWFRQTTAVYWSKNVTISSFRDSRKVWPFQEQISGIAFWIPICWKHHKQLVYLSEERTSSCPLVQLAQESSGGDDFLCNQSFSYFTSPQKFKKTTLIMGIIKREQKDLVFLVHDASLNKTLTKQN